MLVRLKIIHKAAAKPLFYSRPQTLQFNLFIFEQMQPRANRLAGVLVAPKCNIFLYESLEMDSR